MAKAKELIASVQGRASGPLEHQPSTTQDETNLIIAQSQQQFFTRGRVDDVQISQIEQAKYILTALQGDFQAFQWRNHAGYDLDYQYIWWTRQRPASGAAGAELRTHQGPGDRRAPRRQPGRDRPGQEAAIRRGDQQASSASSATTSGASGRCGASRTRRTSWTSACSPTRTARSRAPAPADTSTCNRVWINPQRCDAMRKEGDGMRYVRQKLIQLVIVVFAVTFLTFIAINLLPGDPAIFKAGPGATDAQVEQVRHDLGLDKPIPVQYGIWLKKMATLDFGVSLGFNTPVSELIRNRLPVTLVVLLYAEILSLIIAIPLGVFSAYRAGTTFDRASSTVAFGLLSCRATSSGWCSSTSSRSSGGGSRPSPKTSASSTTQASTSGPMASLSSRWPSPRSRST